MRASEFITEGGGYIPQTEEEAHDPRFEMAITCDVGPGEDVKQAAKFNFKLNKGGRPPFLRSNGKITESPDFSYSNFNNRDNDLQQVIFDVRQNGNEVVAIYDGKDIGGVGFENVSSFDKIAQIFYSQINRDWYGTGLGQILYDKAIQLAKKKGYKYLNSDTRRSIEAEKAWKRLARRYPCREIEDEYGYVTNHQIDLTAVPTKMTESKDQFTKKTDFRFKKGALLMQRLGPINAQKQRIIIRKPPVNRGMWAFPYPAFDMFFAHHKIEPMLPADLRTDAIRAAYDKAKEEGRDNDEDFKEAYQHLWDLREKASDKLKDKMRPKTFWWDGPIYSHISPHEGENDLGSSWYLWTDLKAWAKAANKSMVTFDSYKAFGLKANPAEQGFPTYSADHLEVFLPEKAEITKQKKGR
jgi:GNAT superfamily N-acetyltransferase